MRDVFSFGVLAFELLTGERPYSTPPLLCRLRRHTSDEARRLTDACPDLHPELARHLQAAVSLVPDERPTLEVLVAAFDHPA